MPLPSAPTAPPEPVPAPAPRGRAGRRACRVLVACVARAPLAGLACRGGAPVGPSASPAPSVASASPAPSARPEPRLVGRFDRSSALGPRFAWSGATLEARFRGRDVAVLLRVAPLVPHAVRVHGESVLEDEKTTSYAVTLDGRALAPLAVSDRVERYVVAQGLDPRAVHEVALTRDAEASAGVHQFLGFEVEGGELLPSRGRAHAIEVVGDSIACGYGILGADATCPFTFATERASLAWPSLVGRALDADVSTMCWSGRGVLRNYDGGATGTMPELFELTLPAGLQQPPGLAPSPGPSQPAVPFDFAATTPPDAVVIALGTNDFLGGDAALDVPAFEAAYARFLARVRAVRPRAWLFVAESPMLPPGEVRQRPGDMRAIANASFARIVAARTAAGDARVSLVAMPYQRAGEREGESRVGCDYHPNAVVHRELARLVAAAVRSKLGL